MGRLLFRAARLTRATALARALRPGAVVLCYHNIVDRAVEAADRGLHLPVADFQRQVEWLAAHFRIVSLDDLRIQAERGGRLRGLAAVTFDDGYVGTLAHGLPILRRLGVPATVFVPTGAPGPGTPFWWDRRGAEPAARDAALREHLIEDLGGADAAIRAEIGDEHSLSAQCLPASWDDLRGCASELVSFGAHSVSHRTLPRLGDAALAKELGDSRRELADALGVTPRWMAYPYGRWDARVAAAVRAAGFAGAWTLAGRDVTADGDWYGAPRVNIPAGIAQESFEAWISGFAHVRASRAGPGARD